MWKTECAACQCIPHVHHDGQTLLCSTGSQQCTSSVYNMKKFPLAFARRVTAPPLCGGAHTDTAGVFVHNEVSCIIHQRRSAVGLQPPTHCCELGGTQCIHPREGLSLRFQWLVGHSGAKASAQIYAVCTSTSSRDTQMYVKRDSHKHVSDTEYVPG